MKHSFILSFVFGLCISLLIMPLAGCGNIGQTSGSEVAFEQLLANPEKYKGKDVIVEAFYFHGFETIVLSQSLKYSGRAQGHLVPEGELIWVEGGIPLEVYNKLHHQQMMGPAERYGKVRVKGKFHYCGRYGHVGGFKFQITPAEVELLPWSPIANRDAFLNLYSKMSFRSPWETCFH